MSEVYSKREDCIEICKLFRDKLENKFSVNLSLPVIDGKLFDKENDSNVSKTKHYNYIPFHVKYAKHEFLRVGVCNNPFNNTTMGHKLAALSTLYEVLCREFGDADVFYTVDDDNNTLAFQWCMKNKENEIKKFVDGHYFDDANTKDVIIIDRYYQKEIFKRRVGLPVELAEYVAENIEEFMLYKKGVKMGFSKEVKINGVSVVQKEKTKKLI